MNKLTFMTGRLAVSILLLHINLFQVGPMARPLKRSIELYDCYLPFHPGRTQLTELTDEMLTADHHFDLKPFSAPYFSTPFFLELYVRVLT